MGCDSHAQDATRYRGAPVSNSCDTGEQEKRAYEILVALWQLSRLVVRPGRPWRRRRGWPGRV